MNEIAIFSIASNNYLAYVRVLMQSIKDFHADVDLLLILADEFDGLPNSDCELFEVVEARVIGIPDFERMAFRYDIVEFNTAIKPFCFKYLLGKKYRKVIYLDPDILLCHGLQYLLDILERYSIVVTPHMTVPLPVDDNCTPSEQSCLASGTYNLGFLAVSASEETDAFINWWCGKCFNACYCEIESGLFVDQKWINLVTAYWSSVYVLRHQGYNVAYWNLHERHFNGNLINGEFPLVFFHFSGLPLDALDRISKYQDRFTLTSRPDLLPLFQGYRTLLLSHGHDVVRKAKYKYGYFQDGTVVGPVARRLYPVVAEMYPDPFRVGKGSYLALLKNKHLLEKSSAHMDFVLDILGDDRKKYKYRQFVHFLSKIVLRIFGIRFYHFLMSYMLDNCSIRKQNFLFDGLFSSSRNYKSTNS